MAEKIHPKALLTVTQEAQIVVANEMVGVAKKHGVSPFKQFGHQIGRLVGSKKTRLETTEYYEHRLYLPSLTPAERKAFVGKAGSRTLNLSLDLESGRSSVSVIGQKSLFEPLLQGLGLATTKTQALVGRTPFFGARRTLTSIGEVAEFLRSEAIYPLFGKPVEGSKSIGSAGFTHLDVEADEIVLSSGKRFGVDVLAREIYDDYPEGYLLQDAVPQHSTVSDVIGEAIGSLRMVTVNDGTGAQLLYSVWKIPSPEAMSDNFWQNGSMIGNVDPENGKVTTCKHGVGLAARDVEQHPVSEKPIVGLEIPNWQATCDLVKASHNLFPKKGIIGWDVGIAQDGPIIIEGNTNPFHTLYQFANDRGVNNPEFLEVFDRIRAGLETRKAERKAYLKKLLARHVSKS